MKWQKKSCNIATHMTVTHPQISISGSTCRSFVEPRLQQLSQSSQQTDRQLTRLMTSRTTFNTRTIMNILSVKQTSREVTRLSMSANSFSASSLVEGRPESPTDLPQTNARMRERNGHRTKKKMQQKSHLFLAMTWDMMSARWTGTR
jgi:hypothetical protein